MLFHCTRENGSEELFVSMGVDLLRVQGGLCCSYLSLALLSYSPLTLSAQPHGFFLTAFGVH